MAGAQLVTALATGAMGFTTQPATITAMAFAVGAAASASRPAVAAMMADLVAPEDRTRAFSVNYWAINIGFGLSAAVAGFIAREGYVWLFVGDAVTTLLCGAVMWFKLPETRPKAAPDVPAGGPAARRTGLREVLRDRRFMSLTLLTLGVWSIFYQCSSTLPVVMHGNGLSTRAYGLVIGLNGFLVVLLQIPVTRLMNHHRKGAQLAVSAVLMGGGFGLTGLAGASAGLYAMTVAVWTVGEMLYAPAASAAVANLAPPHAQGLYQGCLRLRVLRRRLPRPTHRRTHPRHHGRCHALGRLRRHGRRRSRGLLAAPARPAPGTGSRGTSGGPPFLRTHNRTHSSGDMTMTIALIESLNFGLGHLADAAAARGQELLLLTSDRSRYAYELSNEPGDSVKVIDVDTMNVDEIITALDGVEDLAGVVRMADIWSMQALETARRLGLPHEDIEAVALLRDKGRMRKHLYDKGFSAAPAVVIDAHTATPEALADVLPFPCIIKDSAGSGSQNIWLVRTPADVAPVLPRPGLPRRCTATRWSPSPISLGPCTARRR